MYNCRDIGGGVAVLRTDYRITCNTTEHQLFRVVAGALIAVFSLGIPLYLVYLCLLYTSDAADE